MLKEIRCEIFKEKIIKFHEGLNVVLGDKVGSNSIGKSTLLMIVDFIFGGNTYITHNKDVVTKLGHHTFLYILEFNNLKLFFKRGTEDPNTVYKCTNDFKIQEAISLTDYNNRLYQYYGLESKQLSFRQAVSLFSRVWGKQNYDVKRPLHNHHSEKNSLTVTRLIKLFNKYDSIANEDSVLKDLNDSKKAINKASKYNFIPKINKTKYKSNVKEIELLKEEIETYSKSMFSPIINASEIISDELLELRDQKNILMEEKDYYKSRYSRADKRITKYTDVGFEKLIEFFPNVNVEKLHSIEEFHQGISTILSKELQQAKKDLKGKIEELEDEINEVNKKVEEILNPNKEPNIFVDNLIESSSNLKQLQLENDFYDKLISINEDIKLKSISLAELKKDIINKIKDDINLKLTEINDLIHKDKRKPPVLELSFKDYQYNLFENTGTGKAYTNLIIFDLAIFHLTRLPFVAHDSFLFKNIEKPAVENLIPFYMKSKKQAFIAIDFINIYCKETQDILNESKVINLSKDNLLFTFDWRDSNTDE
ncbi:DUF2326 domain-containing protein [Fictibacillus nanhaiensis]|uniref:DUF2326 domain-containing protein n=1 Tax=Fictibacillus nanhaiensis TaxID=742169 RepID=UPI002041A196|nr:DUF2326 domain-containing protein [Fictibacillus nanhaiensis]MCM3732351.1 DUF2326 domain-containing protein [Fictibacillus nanhaiensis]